MTQPGVLCSAVAPQTLAGDGFDSHLRDLAWLPALCGAGMARRNHLVMDEPADQRRPGPNAAHHSATAQARTMAA